MPQNLNRAHQTMPEHQRRRNNKQMKDLVARSIDRETFEILFRKLYDLSALGISRSGSSIFTFEAYINAPEALSDAVPAIQPNVIGFSPSRVDNCRPCMIATTPGSARQVNIMIRRAATGPFVPLGTSRAAQQPRARRGT